MKAVTWCGSKQFYFPLALPGFGIMGLAAMAPSEFSAGMISVNTLGSVALALYPSFTMAQRTAGRSGVSIMFPRPNPFGGKLRC